MSELEAAAYVAIELGCTRAEATRLLGREDALRNLTVEFSRDVHRYQDAMTGSDWPPLVKTLAGEGVNGERPTLARMVAASILLEHIIRSQTTVDTVDDVIGTVYYLARDSLFCGDEERSKQAAATFKMCVGFNLLAGGLSGKPDGLPHKPEDLRWWCVV